MMRVVKTLYDMLHREKSYHWNKLCESKNHNCICSANLTNKQNTYRPIKTRTKNMKNEDLTIQLVLNYQLGLVMFQLMKGDRFGMFYVLVCVGLCTTIIYPVCFV